MIPNRGIWRLKMNDCCQSKKTVRTFEEKKMLTARINRIIGQMSGIKRMLEEDRYCDDILIQLSAVERSVKSLSGVILERHIHTCLADGIRKGDAGVVDEISELIKRYQ